MANLDVPFPVEGVDKGRAASIQSSTTSPDMNNMRPYDVLDDRARGGQRPGLDKRYSQRIGTDPSPIVAICKVTVVD